MKRTMCVWLTLGLLALAACNGDDGKTVSSAGPDKIESAGVALPSVILGLEVRVEDVSQEFGRAKRPWIDNLGLFSLRETDLVRATFQVSRFSRAATPEDKSFRSAIVSNLGTVRPQEMNIAKTTIHVTGGNDQSIFVWFAGRGFFVLTTHRDYEFPRTLLRRLVETATL